MQALDDINLRYGRSTVQLASAVLEGQNRVWSMRQERKTPGYTTRRYELALARMWSASWPEAVRNRGLYWNATAYCLLVQMKFENDIVFVKNLFPWKIILNHNENKEIKK